MMCLYRACWSVHSLQDLLLLMTMCALHVSTMYDATKHADNFLSSPRKTVSMVNWPFRRGQPRPEQHASPLHFNRSPRTLSEAIYGKKNL